MLVVESVFDFNFFDILSEDEFMVKLLKMPPSQRGIYAASVAEPGKHQRLATERKVEGEAAAKAAEQTRLAKGQEAARAEQRRLVKEREAAEVEANRRSPEFLANREKKKQKVTGRAIFNNAPSQFFAFNLLKNPPADKK